MVIIPGTSYRYTLFGGISVDNPCTVYVSSQSQNFTYLPRPKEWLTGTADDWGRWGREAMPRQLLLAPDSGTFFNPAYAVAAGSISLGSPAADTLVGVTIYQNSFGLVNGAVQSQSFSLRTTNILVTAGNTVSWQLICGAQNNYNGGPGYTTQIQLSVGVIILNSAGTTPVAQMTQFEFQT